MAGRNNHPDKDGGKSNPGRLDQFGETLASRNEEEFEASAAKAKEKNRSDC